VGARHRDLRPQPEAAIDGAPVQGGQPEAAVLVEAQLEDVRIGRGNEALHLREDR